MCRILGTQLGRPGRDVSGVGGEWWWSKLHRTGAEKVREHLSRHLNDKGHWEQTFFLPLASLGTRSTGLNSQQPDSLRREENSFTISACGVEEGRVWVFIIPYALQTCTSNPQKKMRTKTILAFLYPSLSFDSLQHIFSFLQPRIVRNRWNPESS